MLYNKFAGSALVAVAVMMGAAAVAQDMGGRPGPMMDFSAMDADQDGKVTKAEIEAFKVARFTEADTNKDGKLSVEEVTALRDAMEAKREEDRLAGMIKRFDKDGDGMLSQAELPAQRNGDKMFDRIDTDSDGAISQAEADAAKAKMEERMADRDGKGKDKEGKGHGDSDHDGKGRDGKGPRGGQGGFFGLFGDDEGEAPAE